MKIKSCYILVCVLSAISINALSQSYKEDSVTAAIFTAKNPHEKIMLLGELGALYSTHSPEKVTDLAWQALELADANEDIMYSYNFIGFSHLWQEQYDSALYYFQVAYSMAEEYQDSTYMSKSVNNMGIVYFQIGDLQKGLDAVRESASLDFLRRDYEGAIISFVNLGGIYFQLSEYDKARDNSMKALDLAIQHGYTNYKPDIYGTLGAIEIKLGNYDDGRGWFFKAIELYEKLNDLRGVQTTYSNLGYAFRNEGKYTIAEVYYLKSLEFAEAIQSPEGLQDVYKGLAINNEEMGKESRALMYYKKYMQWKDSVRVKENMDKLLEIQERFNSERTAKENELLIKENRIKNLENRESKAKLNQSRIQIISAVVGMILLIGIAFVLFNRNRLKQRANTQLQIAHDIIQEKNNDITASIEYASKIQEALLPTKENTKIFKDSFFILQPKDIVSGDFLWYSKVDEKIVFLVADCTGHGVPGAFMSMIGNTFLHQIINEKRVLKPSAILEELRVKVIAALSQQDGEDARKDGMDVAVCVLDTTTSKLQFSGANNPLYYVTKGAINEIKGDKQPVGYMPEKSHPFANHEVQLEPGDAVYIFSDGYADQFGGPKGKKFKYKQMRELLFANVDKSMKEQKEQMISAFANWKGELEQIDDVCLIGVRI